MKTKQAVSTKKQNVTVKDLKTKRNPRGGAQLASGSGSQQQLQNLAPIAALAGQAQLALSAPSPGKGLSRGQV